MPSTRLNRRARTAAALTVAAAALLTTGCGGDTVRVRGRLVKNGQPYTANLSGDAPDTFGVDLCGAVQGAPMVYPATLAADGTFSVPGSEGAGVPRGRYKIVVLHSGYLGAGGDRFKARFAAGKTPLEVDLTGSTVLTVDVGAGTVTPDPG